MLNKEIMAVLEDIIKTAKQEMLKNILVRDGAIWATDSHRAIKIVPTESLKLEDGLYQIAKIGKESKLIPNTETPEQTFPDLERVLNMEGTHYPVRERIGTEWFMGMVLIMFGKLQEGVEIQDLSYLDPMYLQKFCKNIGKIAHSVELVYNKPRFPVKLILETTECKIEYMLMPITK